MARKLQMWTNLTALDRGDPMAFVERAKLLESDGWDGATMPDSHFINPEVFATLAACTQATRRLRLGTGVTNPATRHPSVVCASMLTLDALSGGRMVFGIGRGDSPLAGMGGSPVSLKAFEQALEMIRSYLRGEPVPLETAATALARNVEAGFGSVAINHAPEASAFQWLTPGHSRPPLEVFCTGPKVIGIAARHADHITFALGADAERLKWAIGIAREELVRAGRDPASVSFGAHVPTFPHPDVAVSRKLGEGYIAAQARFSVMNRKAVGPMSDRQRRSLDRLAGSYDMQNHGMAGSAQAKALDAELVDDFGIIGSVERGLDRLREIVALGIDRLQLVTSQATTREGHESYRITADQLVARLREDQSGIADQCAVSGTNSQI